MRSVHAGRCKSQPAPMQPAAAEMTCAVFAAVEVTCVALGDMYLLISTRRDSGRGVCRFSPANSMLSAQCTPTLGSQSSTKC